MDAKLLAWARAVKARRRARHPVLWLFTDDRRTPDPLPAIARLPPGSGVVFRHDRVPDRAGLARRIARLCRARRLALTIAGDPRLAAALRAGPHLRGREHPPAYLRGRLCTVAAHDPPALRRARRLPCAVAFLSPVFPTRSHPGARGLGPARFASWVRRSGPPLLALGGIDGLSCRRLTRLCAGVGAIGALDGKTRNRRPIPTSLVL